MANQTLIEDDYHKAKDYLDDVVEGFHDRIDTFNTALVAAYGNYQTIMGAQATRPIWAEVLINFFIFAAPEVALPAFLKGLGGHGHATGGTFPHTLPGVTVGSSSPLTKLREEMAHASEEFAKEVKYELKAGEAVTMTQEISEKDEVRGQLNLEEAKTDAATMIILKLGGNYFDLKQSLNEFIIRAKAWLRKRYKDLSDGKDNNIDMYSRVQTVFQRAGLEVFYHNKIGESQLRAFADQLLYDMLESYVEQYVSFTIVDGVHLSLLGRNFELPMGDGVERHQIDLDAKAFQTKNINFLPGERAEKYVDGINEKQRELIYKKFGSDTHKRGLDRPAIDSYIDLIWFMGAKTVDLRGNEILFSGGRSKPTL